MKTIIKTIICKLFGHRINFERDVTGFTQVSKRTCLCCGKVLDTSVERYNVKCTVGGKIVWKTNSGLWW